MIYYETSAKEGDNVEKAFLDLTQKVHDKNKLKDQTKTYENELLENNNNKKFSSCCSN